MKTPSEHFKEPVIGMVKTKPMTVMLTYSGQAPKPVTYPVDFIEVLAKVTLNGKDAYVSNRWYKSHRYEPVIIMAELVDEFIPLPDATV